MGFEEFKKYIDEIIKFNKFEDKLYDTFRLVDGECYMGFSYSSVMANLLGKFFGDDTDIISYWLYELDCGKEWDEGIVIDEDGNDVRLETLEDLYNVLNKDKEW